MTRVEREVLEIQNWIEKRNNEFSGEYFQQSTEEGIRSFARAPVRLGDRCRLLRRREARPAGPLAVFRRLPEKPNNHFPPLASATNQHKLTAQICKEGGR